MSVIEIKIPDNVNLEGYDIKMAVAAKLYEDGKLSAGQAAEIAGVTKRTFIELLGRYGVSLFSNSVDDLMTDIKNA